ncbi:MAG: guanylate kinase [Bacteroidetes bacterium 4484_276]|nr:MAG: guanylate kinase [Bacteroidetes bacterium 4484_276]OYT14177.1 MAG: guanylate kinase [Bacteroidetes bacterium 4572_114]
MNGKLIIVSAPSGSGKTTIVKQVLASGLKLKFSISACSRKPRGNETNGKDYYFLGSDDFRKKIENNEFIEWEEVYKDNFYGTLKSELQRIWDSGHSVIFDVDVKGGLNIKRQFPDISLAIFIMAPSVDELEKRLRNRATDDDETINKRIAKAEYELSFAQQFDKIIVNDNLEKAVLETYNSVKGFLDGGNEAMGQ